LIAAPPHRACCPTTISGQTIVCIANRWDYDPTSKHQVMKVLASHNRIVWVNYRGSRRPRVSRADATAILATLRDVLSGVQRVSESMVTLTPLVIPGPRHPGLRYLNERLLVAQIRSALRLVGKFGEQCLIYYCVDEYSAFEGFDGQAIRDDEQRLIQKADVVITTSSSLFESKRRLHPRTHLVRHGVDVEHFARAVTRDLPVPEDIAGLPRPIFGFFGLLHHWIDVELVARVARSRPQASFVLLGDCATDVSALRALPNVHLLGRRDYRTLPAYCSAFDVALLPFRINDMTRNVNPIKLREYLAAGLPVVSTPLPEATAYRPDVLVAADSAEFCRCCDQALEDSDPDARRRRSARVAEESWDAVVDRLSGIVGSVVEQSGRAAGVPAAPTGPPAAVETPVLVESVV